MPCKLAPSIRGSLIIGCLLLFLFPLASVTTVHNQTGPLDSMLRCRTTRPGLNHPGVANSLTCLSVTLIPTSLRTSQMRTERRWEDLVETSTREDDSWMVVMTTGTRERTRRGGGCAVLPPSRSVLLPFLCIDLSCHSLRT